jgi:hypothetical protein
MRARPKLLLLATLAGLAAALIAGHTMYWEARQATLHALHAQQDQQKAQQWARERAVREALLGELKTVTLKNCRLKRYGGTHDGGYLLCENLLSGVRAAYSYGIGDEDEWGCQVSRRLGLSVHQYDCFTPTRPSCKGGRFVFHDECVAARQETRDSRRFDTFAAQIAANGDAAKRLLMKIDVDGAEWESLLAAPDDLLDRIEQMPMELHVYRTFQPGFVELIRRLKTKFHLVSLHFNNHACTRDTDPLPSRAFQVLWVNKRIGVLDPRGPSPAPTSPLDAPDAPERPDCQLAN